MKKIDVLLVSLHLLSVSTLCALPQGGQVAEGSAQINYAEQGRLDVRSQDGSVIHWDEFSIQKGEVARFVQESAKSTVFNRVVGNLRSNISGTLESNGHVFLINPNGVTIHKGGLIDTAGFLATSLDFNIQKFLKGEETSFQGKGSVVNLGQIKASEGDVYLLGMEVDNQGSVQAHQGVVYTGAAQNIVLKPSHDKGFYIVVSPESVQKEEGSALRNEGIIEAIQVHMKADGNPYEFAIQNDGAIEATGIDIQDGIVILTAEAGPITGSGSIAAVNASGLGGTIELTGEGVSLFKNASIDVSGKNGGGKIVVGDRGSSTFVAVAKDVCLRANALEEGDGGHVFMCSNDTTIFFGSIESKGGAVSGNGGFSEVSGLTVLYKGLVNTTAPFGKTGMCLIDPTDITIDAGATTGGVVLGPASTIPALAAVSILNTDLNTQLGLSNVSISTATAGPSAGTILITSPITWASTNTLTLTANSDINVRASISSTSAAPGPSITLQSLAGNINIDALAAGAAVGVETVNGPISILAPQGNINILGGAPVSAPAYIGALQGNTTGDLTVECGGQLSVTGGDGNFSYGGIGRFGVGLAITGASTAPFLTTVNVGTDCIMTAGAIAGANSSALIGMGNSFGAAGPFVGDIVVNVGRNLEMVSGGSGGAAVVGSIVPPHQGNIRITVGENLYMHNDPNAGGFIGAQIGGATTNPDTSNWDQNVFITVGRNMTMDARSNPGFDAFTCIQPFNGSAPPAGNGTMSVHVGGDLVMIAGNGGASQCYMLLHSELFRTEVWVGGNIRCFNGLGQDAAFPVPFTFNNPPDVGTVDIRSGGNIIMGGGNINNNGFFSTSAYESLAPNGSIYFQADAPFATNQLWAPQSVVVGGANIFNGTPLAASSTNTSTVAPFGSGGNGRGGFTIDTSRYDISSTSGFPTTSVLGFSAPIVSPNPPVPPLTPANTAISYTASNGALSIFSADRYSDGSGCDLLLCNSFLPYNVGALGSGLPNHVGVSSFGNMTIGNFRNITLDAAPLGFPTLNGGPQTTGGGDILIIANNDMTMNANTSITGTGIINLVVDNQGPVPPQIGGVWSGGGRFVMDATASINSALPDALRIFTACQPLNIISGLLNGAAFVPGPLYVNTNTERWGVWYFDPFFSPPDFYCIFYKCFNTAIIGQFAIPPQEFLIGIHGPNEYLGWLEQFDETYGENKKKDKYTGTSYELAQNEKYMIRQKYYRTNNSRSYTVN
jgi:filamentous hemagglutinin family protein